MSISWTKLPGTTSYQVSCIRSDRVEHNYHDHANDSVADFIFLPNDADQDNVPHLLESLPFPVRLHHMLSDVEKDGLANVVSWQPHGRCFVVHDTKEFEKQVLRSWFKMTKFTSFQRQLNLYGFQRITSGQDKGGYYHELFLRGKRFLCHRIHRKKIKGTGVRKPASPETEPNFYAMPFVTTERSNIGPACLPFAATEGSRPQDSLLQASLITSSFEEQTRQAAAAAALLAPLAPPLYPAGNGASFYGLPKVDKNADFDALLDSLLRVPVLAAGSNIAQSAANFAANGNKARNDSPLPLEKQPWL